jgi:hypothetical protein
MLHADVLAILVHKATKHILTGRGGQPPCLFNLHLYSKGIIIIKALLILKGYCSEMGKIGFKTAAKKMRRTLSGVSLSRVPGQVASSYALAGGIH